MPQPGRIGGVKVTGRPGRDPTPGPGTSLARRTPAGQLANHPAARKAAITVVSKAGPEGAVVARVAQKVPPPRSATTRKIPKPSTGGKRPPTVPRPRGKSLTGVPDIDRNLLKARSARKLLVAEFVVCMIILAFSPLTDKHGNETAGTWMKRSTAMCFLFIILGLVATGGRIAGQVAAGLGGLVALALLLNDRDIFATLAKKLTPQPVPGAKAFRAV